MTDKDQKTETATAKRKRDAARDGDILQSRDLATALVMLAGAAWLMLAGPLFAREMQHVLEIGLVLKQADIDSFDPAARLATLIAAALPSLILLFAITLVATIAGPAALGALGFRSNAFAFKGNRLDPLAGVKRIFGAQGLVELGKSLMKVVLIGAIGWWFLSASSGTILGLGGTPFKHAAATMGSLLGRILLWLAAGLAVIGLVDAPVQWLRRAARLRMSKQEIKEEMKESEGSPEIKMQARQMRFQILNGSARKAVTEASVVITNPTHFAVAIRYRPGVDAVPIVVARGRGETALAIKALAMDTEIPTLAYPQLTRAIYFTTRAGQPIAKDLYIAVATILAFVFNLDRAMAEGHRQPEVSVPEAKRFDEGGRRDS